MISLTKSKRQMNGPFRSGSRAKGYRSSNIATDYSRETNMIRIALAGLITAAAAGSALALIPAHQATELAATRHETVIAKTETWSAVSPLTVDECIDDACTMTISN